MQAISLHREGGKRSREAAHQFKGIDLSFGLLRGTTGLYSAELQAIYHHNTEIANIRMGGSGPD